MVTHNDVYLPRSQPSITRRDANKTSCFSDICGCISLGSVALFSAFIIATIVLNILGREPLDGEIPTIKIDTITVSNFNLSNPISAHWNINMTMHTTDSSFEFSDSRIAIFHETKKEALWMISLKKFDMRPKNSTFHFALDFWGSSAEVDDSTVKSIGENITNNLGAVKFNVEFKADKPRTIRLKYPIEKLWYDTKLNRLVIRCDVLLIFGWLDKTHADMLKTDSQECILVTYGS